MSINTTDFLRKLSDSETNALRFGRHVHVDSPETLLVNFDCRDCDDPFTMTWSEIQAGWPACDCGEPAILTSAYRQTGPVEVPYL